MKVEVRDCLANCVVDREKSSLSVERGLNGISQQLPLQEHRSDEIGGNIRKGDIVFPRAEQHVAGEKRVRVEEGYKIAVLADTSARNLPGDDPAENTILIHARQLSPPKHAVSRR